MANAERAKIFICCGQTENTIEEEVAKEITQIINKALDIGGIKND